MSKIIAITIGDINGIGIKILFDLWKNNKVKSFILICDINKIKQYIKKNNIKCDLNVIDTKKRNINFKKNKFNIYTYRSNTLEDNTYKSLKYAYEFCKSKICIGIITLPLRKDLIKEKINKNFIGHTEFFQNIDKKKFSNMILYHKKIIISPLTTHLELKKVAKYINNKDFLYNQIYNLNNILKIDFNIKNPKLIISGLNPHAGENGNLGNEEQKIILPTIKRLNLNDVNIDGPYSADSILIKKNLQKYHCFIFIYHDQALIPFKYISQFSGVNYTGNLDIIRTSPDHGTAYNLINSKNISNKSFINCYKLIKKIYNNRIMNVKS